MAAFISNNIFKDSVVSPFTQLFASKHYKWFDGGKPFNLNIFGVRSGKRVTGFFDDYIYCVYRDYLGNWVINQWKATTDPGSYYLQRPLNIKGTAVLIPGQYRGVYKIDKHNGKYDALCQRLGKVEVYRDNNKDNVIDTVDPEWGRFGINIHRSHKHKELDEVGPHSAGCQVFANPHDFDQFMDLCRRSARLYGNKFTYSLFS